MNNKKYNIAHDGGHNAVFKFTPHFKILGYYKIVYPNDLWNLLSKKLSKIPALLELHLLARGVNNATKKYYSE